MSIKINEDSTSLEINGAASLRVLAEWEATPADSKEVSEKVARPTHQPCPSKRGQAHSLSGAQCVELPDGHDSLAVGGRELGRGLGDIASGVPATAQCR
jgi:hypothetical protein